MGHDALEVEHEGGGLAIHAVVFVAVNLLLIAIWGLFAPNGSFAEVPALIAHPSQARAAGFFPIYVMIFWGAGLLIHAGVTFVTAPRRWRARRAKARARRERRDLQASVVGALGDNLISDAAVAGIRMVEGDKAAKQVKRKAARQSGGKAKLKAKAKGSGKAKKAKKERAAAPVGDAENPVGGAGTHGDGPDTRSQASEATGRASGAASSSGSAAPPQSVTSRHWVAVLFTDIVNSTPLNESLGDDTWSGLLSTHRRIVRECIGLHRGTEVGTQGDGFLIRFEVPDDAAACAMALQREMATERASSNHALHVRMGIHAGEVVHNDDDLVGRVINLAARVTGAAAPDEILVTEPFADHLSVGHLLTDRGLKILKGFDQPRHLIALVWDDALDEIVLED